jgi:hypothetical protein
LHERASSVVLGGREIGTALLERWHLTKPMERTALLTFYSLYLDFSMDVMRGIGEAWSARFEKQALKSTVDGRQPHFGYELWFDPSLAADERRLRLGLVSGDVCMDPPEHHPVGKAMRHVWSSFDRSRVDVVLFCHIVKDEHGRFAATMAENEIIHVPLYQPDGNLMSDMQVRVPPPSHAVTKPDVSPAPARCSSCFLHASAIYIYIYIVVYQPDGNLMSDMQVRVPPPSHAVTKPDVSPAPARCSSCFLRASAIYIYIVVWSCVV